MQTNILEYLEESARRAPEKTAISGETGELTFGALSDAARRIGSCLLGHGVTKAPVVVLMPRCPETIAAFLGAVYGGCYYVPLDPEMPRQRMDRLLKKLDPGILICDQTTEKTARELRFLGPVICYDRAAGYELDEEGLAGIRQWQLDIDPVYIVFTSGSTGDPKGVVGCHRAVIDYIEAFCEVMGFDEDTVFGNQTPLYFDAYLKEIIPTLKYGATTHLIPKRLFTSPLRLVEYLNEKKINTICWVASALTLVSAFQTFDAVRPLHLRLVAFASEVLPIRQLNIWREALPNARFVNLYGPTETTGICCYYEVEREFAVEETLPIGRPFRNTEILLLDEAGQPSSRGEICIRGTRLTLGYYRDPKRTAASFSQNPQNSLYPEPIYHTGDLGCRNERGELMYLGRIDHQVKHMGHRIELGEIEAAASGAEGVGTICCVHAGQKLHLYYTGTAAYADLAARLRERLPRYMRPQAWHRLEEMPLLPNGKIDRRELEKRSVAHG